MLNNIYGAVGLSFVGYINYRFYDERSSAISRLKNIRTGLSPEAAYRSAIFDVDSVFMESFRFNDRKDSYKHVDGYIRKARAFADSVDINLWFTFAGLSNAVFFMICCDNLIGRNGTLDLTGLCMLSAICAATTGEVINNIMNCNDLEPRFQIGLDLIRDYFSLYTDNAKYYASAALDKAERYL